MIFIITYIIFFNLAIIIILKDSKYINFEMFSKTKYFSGLTVTDLKPELTTIISRIYLKVGSWEKTKSIVIKNNELQTRSNSTGIRLERELRQRLKNLSEPQLILLAKGSINDRLAMTWLGVLKRIKLVSELSHELLLEKIEGSDPILRRSDMAEFYKKKEKQFSEFKNLSDTSHKRINSIVLSMLREMGLLVGESKTKGDLGTLQRYNLSTQSRELIDTEGEIYSGFLLKSINKGGG